jgi:hypothetical protein
MAKQNQSQASDVEQTTNVDLSHEATTVTDADQKAVANSQAAVLPDEYHGQGGLYEVRQGQRVLIERTGE